MLSRRLIKNFQLSILLCFISISLSAQVYLQIERINSTKRIKLVEGTEINFKLKSYKDTWRKATIDQILPESNAMVIDGDIIKPEEFYTIRLLKKPFLKSLGTQLERFALSLAVYGTIVELANLDEFWYEGYILSGGIFALGRLMRIIFKSKTYNFEKRFRLRIVDTRFFVP